MRVGECLHSSEAAQTTLVDTWFAANEHGSRGSIAVDGLQDWEATCFDWLKVGQGMPKHDPARGKQGIRELACPRRGNGAAIAPNDVQLCMGTPGTKAECMHLRHSKATCPPPVTYTQTRSTTQSTFSTTTSSHNTGCQKHNINFFTWNSSGLSLPKKDELVQRLTSCHK